MAAAQSGDQNVYILTQEGDDFIPETAKWTCKSGPTESQCGHVNKDISNKICERCHKIRSNAVAHVGERLDEGLKGRCWEIRGVTAYGAEVWTYEFGRKKNEFWARFDSHPNNL